MDGGAVEPSQIATEADDGGDFMSKYWANAVAEELAGHVDEKERRYFDAVDRRGLGDLWRLAYCYAFGMPTKRFSGTTHALSFNGPQGEYIRFRCSIARSYIKQQMIMAKGQRPSFQALALNSDWQSRAQVNTAQKCIDYIYRRTTGGVRSSGQNHERETLYSKGYFGSSFGWMRWDMEGGDDVTISEDREIPGIPGARAPIPVTVRSGAPKLQQLYPWEYFREPYTRDQLWGCVRERVSKWQLAAAVPHMADKILGMGGSATSEQRGKASFAALFMYDLDSLTEDDVIVKHFYHRRCAALPNGRYMASVGGVVLWDRPCPVAEGIPVEEYCTNKYFGTQFAYSDGWDMFAIQEAVETLNSDTITNYSTFGRQNVAVTEGTSIDIKQMAAGLRLFKIPKGAMAPTPIQPFAMPPEKGAFVQYLHGLFDIITGLNATARGTSTTNVTSGAMAALYHSIAVEFQSDDQEEFDSYRERVANLALDFVRTYASTPFLVQVAGTDEMPYMEAFTAEDVMGVKRVQIVTSSPAMRSIATRFEIFNAVLALPPDQRGAAIEMLVSGDMTEFTRQARSSKMHVKYENEQIAKGFDVAVSATDHPIEHLLSHVAEYEANSENPQVRSMYLKHIYAHLKGFYEVDPVLAGLLGFPSPPPKPEALMGDPFAQGAMMAGQQAGAMSRAMQAGQPATAGDKGGGPSMPPSGQESPSDTAKPKPAKPPKGAPTQDYANAA